MTDPKRPLKVFLCHAHADRDPVRALYTRLTNDGVDAWLDKAKLLPGQDWELEIRKAVREADVVVVCLSKQFNQAGFRQKEVRLALDTAMEQPEGEIFIIPARLEECDNLESLRKWHWVDLFEEDGYQMLMRALRARADRIGATLQVKKSWLPNVTAPRGSQTPVQKKPVQRQAFSNADKPAPKKNVLPRKTNSAIIVAIIGLVGTLGAALISSPILEKMFSRTPEPTSSASSSTETRTPPPTTTRAPATNTPAPPTFTPTPGIGSFIESDGVTMMFVPAGSFSMGSSETSSDERPIHAVNLSAYYIDKYEVTNAAYERCVEAGACLPPNQSRSSTRTAYYGNPEFDEFPVIYVDWTMAKTYCEWRGDRLPTEAEWEKAARGTDGRTYPWGEGIACDKLNYNNCKGDMTKVGSYLDGVSPYGLYDMAGNVWEWVNDWYDSNYYQSSPASNPLGPSSGQYRVLRGGSWSNFVFNVRSANRNYNTPDVINNLVGFRCARSLP